MKTRTVTVFLLVLLATAHAQTTKTQNVIIVTLDGYRWQELFTGADPVLVKNEKYVRGLESLLRQFWDDDPIKRRKALMPFFWSVIAREGQLYGNRAFGNHVGCTNGMWFSYPGYNEILTGHADDDRITSNAKVNNPNVTVLESVNRLPGFQGKVAAFGSWDVFPFIINEERSGVPVNAGFETAAGAGLSATEVFLNGLQKEIPSPWDEVRLDAFTHHYAMEYIKRKQPRLVYIAYGETDDFAHDGNYGAYLKAAHRTDGFIRQLWEWLQSDDHYKDKTTLVITTDHGRGALDAWRGHGREVKGSGEVWFAVLGPDTTGKGEVKTPGQYYQNQMAATVAALLEVGFAGAAKAGKPVKGAVDR
ncbi:MAG: sulfatase-like hydrolase/transferase [Cyclobacteriaceae bacterium]|nr:sulfatase-like hydrolase/transferase [Cyclobacteriaceae bacterium]MCB0498436.1 sulfatase-like hydrolase/transferase [Cyclobacteriaceae bacterium]MCB9236994.1 sulfatase-like hydrolase/transferase [Flammeovirgaceae bacterium]MCO5271640.1 sulfatase-like hydrolase/transferase [Cyclobacteriaceae bacterium]MCW5901296.1 sulfatase-like hydrolase/transferase [Cyclobacteriaceae bacterium]